MKLTANSFIFPAIAGLTILIFYFPTIFQGKLPLPADTIPALHHPIKDALKPDYPNGPPYRNFLITDSIRQQYPWREFSINQLKQGQIPWWNPFNFAGTPHLANLQSASFYPLNFIYWLVDFPTGWSFQVIAQSVIGIIFMYLFLRSEKLTTFAATFGSLTWIFSGFFIAWLQWNTAVHVLIYTPLILLALKKIISADNIKLWSPILAFALVSQIFAGYPQPWVYVTFFQLSYLALIIPRHRVSKSILAIITLTYLIAFSLGSLQLLPALQYAPLSNRAIDQGGLAYSLTRPDWFIPPQNLIQLIAPDFFGNPAKLNYFGVFNYTEFVSFIGIIPALFVLIWLFSSPRNRFTWFLLFWITLCLLLGLSNPISIFIQTLNLPLLGGSQPSRIISLLNLTLSIAAAFGANQLTKTKPPKTLPAIALLWVILIIAGLITLTPLVPPESVSIARKNLILPLAELIFASVVLTILTFKTPSSLKFRTILITLLFIPTTFSVLRFATTFTSFSDPKFLYPSSKLLTIIASDPEPVRYSTTDPRIMSPNVNMPYHIQSIEGYDPLYLASYGALLTSIEQGELVTQSRPFNRIVRVDQASSPLLNLLGVKYVLSFSQLPSPQFTLIDQEGDTLLYQNNQVLPRAFTTSIDNPFELNQSNIISATILSYTPNQVILTTSSKQQEKLILADSFYPDWRVTIDSKPGFIENWHGLRATIVPAGTHEIVFNYTNPFLQRLNTP